MSSQKNQSQSTLLQKIIESGAINHVEAHFLSLVVESLNSNSKTALLLHPDDLSIDPSIHSLMNLSSSFSSSDFSSRAAQLIVFDFLKAHELQYTLSSFQNEFINPKTNMEENKMNITSKLELSPHKSVIKQLILKRNLNRNNQRVSDMEQNAQIRAKVASKLLALADSDNSSVINSSILRDHLQKSILNARMPAKQTDSSDNYDSVDLQISSSLPPVGISSAAWEKERDAAILLQNSSRSMKKSKKNNFNSDNTNLSDNDSKDLQISSSLLPLGISSGSWERKREAAIQFQNIDSFDSNLNGSLDLSELTPQGVTDNKWDNDLKKSVNGLITPLHQNDKLDSNSKPRKELSSSLSNEERSVHINLSSKKRGDFGVLSENESDSESNDKKIQNTQTLSSISIDLSSIPINNESSDEWQKKREEAVKDTVIVGDSYIPVPHKFTSTSASPSSANSKAPSVTSNTDVSTIAPTNYTSSQWENKKLDVISRDSNFLVTDYELFEKTGNSSQPFNSKSSQKSDSSSLSKIALKDEKLERDTKNAVANTMRHRGKKRIRKSSIFSSNTSKSSYVSQSENTKTQIESLKQLQKAIDYSDTNKESNQKESNQKESNQKESNQKEPDNEGTKSFEGINSSKSSRSSKSAKSSKSAFSSELSNAKTNSSSTPSFNLNEQLKKMNFLSSSSSVSPSPQASSEYEAKAYEDSSVASSRRMPSAPSLVESSEYERLQIELKEKVNKPNLIDLNTSNMNDYTTKGKEIETQEEDEEEEEEEEDKLDENSATLSSDELKSSTNTGDKNSYTTTNQDASTISTNNELNNADKVHGDGEDEEEEGEELQFENLNKSNESSSLSGFQFTPQSAKNRPRNIKGVVVASSSSTSSSSSNLNSSSQLKNVIIASSSSSSYDSKKNNENQEEAVFQIPNGRDAVIINDTFDLQVGNSNVGFEFIQQGSNEDEDNDNDSLSSDGDFKSPSQKAAKLRILQNKPQKNKIEYVSESTTTADRTTVLEMPPENEIVVIDSPIVKKSDSTTQTEKELTTPKRRVVKIKKKKHSSSTQKHISASSFFSDIDPNDIYLPGVSYNQQKQENEKDNEASDSSSNSSKNKEARIYNFEDIVKNIPDTKVDQNLFKHKNGSIIIDKLPLLESEPEVEKVYDINNDQNTNIIAFEFPDNSANEEEKTETDNFDNSQKQKKSKVVKKVIKRNSTDSLDTLNKEDAHTNSSASSENSTPKRVVKKVIKRHSTDPSDNLNLDSNQKSPLIHSNSSSYSENSTPKRSVKKVVKVRKTPESNKTPSIEVSSEKKKRQKIVKRSSSRFSDSEVLSSSQGKGRINDLNTSSNFTNEVFDSVDQKEQTKQPKKLIKEEEQREDVEEIPLSPRTVVVPNSKKEPASAHSHSSDSENEDIVNRQKNEMTPKSNRRNVTPNNTPSRSPAIQFVSPRIGEILDGSDSDIISDDDDDLRNVKPVHLRRENNNKQKETNKTTSQNRETEEEAKLPQPKIEVEENTIPQPKRETEENTITRQKKETEEKTPTRQKKETEENTITRQKKETEENTITKPKREIEADENMNTITQQKKEEEETNTITQQRRESEEDIKVTKPKKEIAEDDEERITNQSKSSDSLKRKYRKKAENLSSHGDDIIDGTSGQEEESQSDEEQQAQSHPKEDSTIDYIEMFSPKNFPPKSESSSKASREEQPLFRKKKTTTFNDLIDRIEAEEALRKQREEEEARRIQAQKEKENENYQMINNHKFYCNIDQVNCSSDSTFSIIEAAVRREASISKQQENSININNDIPDIFEEEEEEMAFEPPPQKQQSKIDQQEVFGTLQTIQNYKEENEEDQQTQQNPDEVAPVNNNQSEKHEDDNHEYASGKQEEIHKEEEEEEEEDNENVEIIGNLQNSEIDRMKSKSELENEESISNNYPSNIVTHFTNRGDSYADFNMKEEEEAVEQPVEISSIICELPPNEEESQDEHENEDSTLDDTSLMIFSKNKKRMDELRQQQAQINLPKNENEENENSQSSDSEDQTKYVAISPRNPLRKKIPSYSYNCNYNMNYGMKNREVPIQNENEQDKSDDSKSVENSDYVPLSPKNPNNRSLTNAAFVTNNAESTYVSSSYEEKQETENKDYEYEYEEEEEEDKKENEKIEDNENVFINPFKKLDINRLTAHSPKKKQKPLSYEELMERVEESKKRRDVHPINNIGDFEEVESSTHNEKSKSSLQVNIVPFTESSEQKGISSKININSPSNEILNISSIHQPTKETKQQQQEEEHETDEAIDSSSSNNNQQREDVDEKNDLNDLASSSMLSMFSEEFEKLKDIPVSSDNYKGRNKRVSDTSLISSISCGESEFNYNKEESMLRKRKVKKDNKELNSASRFSELYNKSVQGQEESRQGQRIEPSSNRVSAQEENVNYTIDAPSSFISNDYQRDPNRKVRIIKGNSNQVQNVHNANENSSSLFSAEFTRMKDKDTQDQANKQDEDEEERVDNINELSHISMNDSEPLFSDEFEKIQSKPIQRKKAEVEDHLDNERSTNHGHLDSSNNNNSLSAFSVEFDKIKNKPIRRNQETEETKNQNNCSVISESSEHTTSFSTVFEKTKPRTLNNNAQKDLAIEKVEQEASNKNNNHEASSFIDNDSSFFSAEYARDKQHNRGTKNFSSTRMQQKTEPVIGKANTNKEDQRVNQNYNNNKNSFIDDSSFFVSLSDDFYRDPPSRFIKKKGNNNESSDLISEISNGISDFSDNEKENENEEETTRRQPEKYDNNVLSKSSANANAKPRNYHAFPTESGSDSNNENAQRFIKKNKDSKIDSSSAISSISGGNSSSTSQTRDNKNQIQNAVSMPAQKGKAAFNPNLSQEASSFFSNNFSKNQSYVHKKDNDTISYISSGPEEKTTKSDLAEQQPQKQPSQASKRSTTTNNDKSLSFSLVESTPANKRDKIDGNEPSGNQFVLPTPPNYIEEQKKLQEREERKRLRNIISPSQRLHQQEQEEDKNDDEDEDANRTEEDVIKDIEAEHSAHVVVLPSPIINKTPGSTKKKQRSSNKKNQRIRTSIFDSSVSSDEFEHDSYYSDDEKVNDSSSFSFHLRKMPRPPQEILSSSISNSKSPIQTSKLNSDESATATPLKTAAEKQEKQQQQQQQQEVAVIEEEEEDVNDDDKQKIDKSSSFTEDDFIDPPQQQEKQQQELEQEEDNDKKVDRIVKINKNANFERTDNRTKNASKNSIDKSEDNESSDFLFTSKLASEGAHKDSSNHGNSLDSIDSDLLFENISKVAKTKGLSNKNKNDPINSFASDFDEESLVNDISDDDLSIIPKAGSSPISDSQRSNIALEDLEDIFEEEEEKPSESILIIHNVVTSSESTSKKNDDFHDSSSTISSIDGDRAFGRVKQFKNGAGTDVEGIIEPVSDFDF